MELGKESSLMTIENLSTERARLDVLDSYHVLDSDPEQGFDDLATIAAAICGVPISLVSFVAEDRQWFKAETGLGIRETPREMSFCAHTFANKRTLIVEDTYQDSRFIDNALVTGEPGIRFYAGAPIVTETGHALGTVCVIDRKPRTLEPAQIAALEALARQASSLLEHRLSSAANKALAVKEQEAREQAEADRERLWVAMDAASLAAWFYDPNRNIVGGDRRMAKLFGMSELEGPADVWLRAIVDEDRARVGQEFAASLEGAPYDTNYRVLVDGDLRWLHARAKIHKNVDGSSRMTGVCEDITREKLLTLDLAKFAERLAIAQETSGGTTFDWDLRTNRVSWIGNSFGRPPSEITDASQVFKLVHEADRDNLRRVIQHSLETGDEYKYECRGYWLDGSVHWIATAGKPLRDELGQIATVVGVNLDITDRKISEEALLRTEKLMAVDRLASTISHEINNPLEAVTNLLYITRTSPSLAQADRDHLELADRELSRVSNIVARTLRFHRNSSSPMLVNAARIIDDVLGLYQSRLHSSKVETKLQVGSDVSFMAYEGDIRQVLNNLVGNAFDVMRQGGTLQIRARCATDWTGMRHGAVITVADTGAGIPLEARARLFEAFFSTKGIHGSGLGLGVAKRIVHKHHGRLLFRTCTGPIAGTVFRLWLPLKAASTAGEPWA